MSKKVYKVSAPLGNVMIPNDQMTEQQLRDFLPQIVQDPESAEIWKEKALKDPIETLIEYLKLAGYELEIIETS